MIAIKENLPRLNPEEYLDWEEKQGLRHEYIDGEVYAMTGGTVNHGRIAANIIALLIPKLRGGNCRLQTSDVKVALTESNDYLYPDISVTCDQRDRTATKFISHPCLIVEVLSPSTEAYDRWDKFNLYRRSPSLRDYVLVSTNKVAVDIYHKNDRGRWEIMSYGAGDRIELESVNVTFPIEELFEEITFDLG